MHFKKIINFFLSQRSIVSQCNLEVKAVLDAAEKSEGHNRRCGYIYKLMNNMVLDFPMQSASHRTEDLLL